VLTLLGGMLLLSARPIQADEVDLGVMIRESTLLPLLNQVMTYTVTVTNRGPANATGVVVHDQLPAGSVLLAAVPQTGTHQVSGDVVIWTIGALPAGGAASLELSVSPSLLGATINTASVTAHEPDLNPADNSAISSVTTLLGALPEILSGPQSQESLLGLPVTLVVEALSALPLRYQWRLNGVNIPGATNDSLYIPQFQLEHAGSYTVLVMNDLGITTSHPAEVRPILTLGLPFEDNFADRRLLTDLSVLGLGQNLNATVESGEPPHAGKPTGKTKWISWRSLFGGIATVRTTGSTFDTVLAVYTGDSLETLTPVAADDDSGGFLTSAVEFNVVAGQKYHIAVGGYDGASGLILFNLGFELTGGRLPVITAHPEGRTVAPGSDVSLSVQATGTDLGYQWFRDGAAIPGATASVLALPAVGVPQVGVYAVRVTSGSRGVLSRAASLQLFIPGEGEAFREVRAEDKLTDLLRSIPGILLPPDNQSATTTSSKTTSTKTGTKSTRPQSPDDRVGTRSTARGYTGTHVFSTYGSVSQPGEPHHCDSPGGASQWVGYEAPEKGVLVLDTEGSNFDTILGVYTGSGSDFSSLQPVACDDNSGSNGVTSRVVFDVQAGTTYFIAVDGVNGQSGKVILNYNLMIPPGITFQPGNQISAAGAEVRLAVGVTGRPVPELHWRLNGRAIDQATNSTLTIPALAPEHEGAYVLSLANPAGRAETAPASVLIDAPLKLAAMKFDAAKQAKFQLVGLHSTTYLIQASTNLIDWATIATNYTDCGILSYLDARSTDHPNRFYRAVPVQP
jgi:uncharacterized repeat protein (TIGR01451 family)